MLTLDVLDDTDCAPPSACCDPAFPDSMTLTFSNGGACPLYDGLTVTLNYDSGLGDWIGTISTPLPFCGFGPGFDEPNVLTYFVLTCFRGEPALWASLITGQDCGTAFAQASDGGTCSPINFTFSLTVASSGVCSCCADGTTLTATLTSLTCDERHSNRFERVRVPGSRILPEAWNQQNGEMAFTLPASRLSSAVGRRQGP